MIKVSTKAPPPPKSLTGSDTTFSGANEDPFKYSHGLSGVNQPANYLFVNVLLAIALSAATLTACFRVITVIQNSEREYSMIYSSHEQDGWKQKKSSEWAWLKRHILYAPLFTTLHKRKLSIPGIANVGTLPTRLQFIIIAVYYGSNILYCLSISQGPVAKQYAEFRGRCGVLAAYNLILTVLFALRNNPFIWILNVKYDTFNVFHRWIGRLVFLEAFAHVFAFMYSTSRAANSGHRGVESIVSFISDSPSYIAGFAAFMAFVVLTVHSMGPLRLACYKWFLTLHRFSMFVALAGIYFHLSRHDLPQLPWIHLIGAIIVLEYLVRLLRIFHYNFSIKRHKWTKVTLEPLADEVTRVTFLLPKAWTAGPGAHIHVYLPGITLWQSHPFSVAWTQCSSDGELDSENALSASGRPEAQSGVSTVSCLVRAKTGITRTLYNKALAENKNGRKICWGAIEGPYGGHHSVDSYGTVVLFAAGVGIAHQLLYIQQLLIGHNENKTATRKILLIWCIRSIEVVKWIEAWLADLVAMRNFQDVVRIQLYLSLMSSSDDIDRYRSIGINVRNERCCPQEIVDEEISSQAGAMVVTVCGPGGFSDDVRAAVRKRVEDRSIDYIEEGF